MPETGEPAESTLAVTTTSNTTTPDTTGSASAQPPIFDPLRPPALPLAVRSPYLSTWMPSSILAGTWANFWTGRTTAMTRYLRVDGVDYLFLGAPSVSGHPVSRAV